MTGKNWYLPALMAMALMACSQPQQRSEEGGIAHAKSQYAQDNLSEVSVVHDPQMDALLQSYIDHNKAPGLAAMVIKDGRVVYANAHGWKDPDNNIPASLDDYYVLFSQTKAVVTVAFMTLVEQGLVAIDDPVADYFPGIPDTLVTGKDEDGNYLTEKVSTPMTFVHLMSHTSGLGARLAGEMRSQNLEGDARPIGFFGAPEPDFIPHGQHTGGGDMHAAYLRDEMQALAEYPLGFEPGADWDYHISTNMLGYLIERISGMPLRQYVKQSVLEPLGMKDTDWYFSADKQNRFIKAYSLVDGVLEPRPDYYSQGAVSEQQTYAEGAIGLNGPITDYAKFCLMLLNRGEYNGQRILKAETVERMTQINRLPTPNSGGEGFEFGLGFRLFNDNSKPVAAISNSAYAWGGMMGTEYLIDPQHQMVTLFYLNMYDREDLYTPFLKQVYKMIDGAE
ncbi:serine hydrolase domain-containing protein [Lacimicrobium alkaliphilum]|uniref:Beta-lactamase-related domain-containing protein n=1 Tax=Lacimicrobium alkaliphilum TaxID=1526571 RepID=A0A0U3AFG1_9ALTE|nr:serine hydrolase domain-containing protein [Lacimicrobium alkaliphilum]ALS99774.1 hypothetical protein AT746_16870 [Lacimicrobium alkaliphilum]